MRRKSFNWMALVAVGLVTAVAALTATAPAARTAASTFELVAIDRFEGDCPDWWTCPGGTYVGTFTAGAPFCESGTIDHVAALGQPGETRRYTCSDGSGSVTLAERTLGFGRGDWRIVEGSGDHAGLRGKGSHGWEQLSAGPPAWVFRTTFQGFAAADAVAPSLTFTSASATKLRRPVVGEYELRITFSLRDDVDGNAVAYRLKVKEGPEHARDRRLMDLAAEEGSTASGTVSTTLRVLPSSTRVRSVKLVLSGSDPVGNETSVVQLLKLPRR